MIKHIQAWLLYLVLFTIRAAAVLTGLVVVPIAYATRDRERERFRRLFWLWDNDEDGLFGPRWFNKGDISFATCYKWSAIRNPANNMRYIDLFNVSHDQEFTAIVKGDLEHVSAANGRKYNRAMWHYTLVKQNGLWYPSYWYIRTRDDGTHFRVRLGWKCTPQWIDAPRGDAYIQAGLTFQFMPFREG